MKISLAVFVTALIFFCGTARVFPQSPPQPGYVWVPPHKLDSGEVIPGFWRAPFKKGFYWVEGRDDGSGNWIPGHWNPIHNSSTDQAWVAGYWDGTVWVAGYWRPAVRPGYTWVNPYWEGGSWHRGRWRAYEGGQPWKSHFPRP